MLIGNPTRQTGGIMLGLGAGGVGQVLDLIVPAPPGTIADGGDQNPGCVSAANGSTARNINGGTNTTLWVKVNGSWVAIA
jgi:hypothetical protein